MTNDATIAMVARVMEKEKKAQGHQVSANSPANRPPMIEPPRAGRSVWCGNQKIRKLSLHGAQAPNTANTMFFLGLPFA
jgi:hypothetical protein